MRDLQPVRRVRHPTWHYHVTGSMIEEIFAGLEPGHRLAGYVSATGSAGTIGAGDRLRVQHPDVKVVATEALQCPTLYQLGFGGHRIEGIGDKARSLGAQRAKILMPFAAIDDEQCMSLFRLFNEPAGQDTSASIYQQVVSNCRCWAFRRSAIS